MDSTTVPETKQESVEKTQRHRSDSLSILVDTADKEMKVSDQQVIQNQQRASMIRNYFKQSNKLKAMAANRQNSLLQMYSYPPHPMITPFNPYMMNNLTNGKPKKKKRGRKRKREIPPPKKAMSAYNVFFKDTRVKLLEEFEKITFEQLGKEVAKRWHKLSAKDRVPYQKRSRLDKERFKREMEAYKIKLALKEKFMEQNKLRMLHSTQQHMYPMNLLQRSSAPFLHVPSPTVNLPYPHMGGMKRVDSSQPQQLYPNTAYLPPPPSHNQRLPKIPKIMMQKNATNMIEVRSAIDSNIHGKILNTKPLPVSVEASDVSQVPRTSPVLVEATGSTVSSGSEDISSRFDEEDGDDLVDPALS